MSNGGLFLHAVHISKRRRYDGALVSLRRRLHDRRLGPIPTGSSSSSSNKNHNNEMTQVRDWVSPSRNRTMGLLRLCLASYPACYDDPFHKCGYPAEVMEEIYQSNESIYGSNVTSKEQENAAQKALLQTNTAIVRGQPAQATYIKEPESQAEFIIGVEALEWKYGNVTVLAFRGTYSDGDYANIEHWLMDYVLQKSTARMKDAWQHDANLTWTDEMESRSKHNDVAERLAIQMLELHRHSGDEKSLKEALTGKKSFAQELHEAVQSDKNLSNAIGGMAVDEAQTTGYWKITKRIADTVVTALSPSDDQQQQPILLLTGHSQGGTRAQLAAMYLQKATGVAYPTITFGATGSACAARLFSNAYSASLLDDVDPFMEHPDMTDYVHPLDPWGNTMLGVETGGQVCFWGVRALQLGDDGGAYKYCSRVYGWSGPIILLANAGYGVPGRRNVNAHQLGQDLQLCRYFTHMAEATLLALQHHTTLEGDGTPDGGCRKVPVIPEDDPEGLCPNRSMPLDEKVLAVMLTIVVLFLFIGSTLCGVCCCFGCKVRIYRLSRMGCTRRRYYTSAPVEEVDEQIELGPIT